MNRKRVSAVTLTLLLTSILTLAFNIQPVKASGTIYIRVDGRIDPPTANITTADNITYTFTDNNYDGIVVERGNIVIDGNGYTLQGTGSGSGFYWSGTNNVAIKNTKIRGFNLGIYLEYSKNNSIVGNNITANNEYGILLSHASNSTLSGNVMGGNRYNFGVVGDYLQSVDTSNLVDGKPVYYFMNQSDIVVNADAYPQVGYLGFVNCANVTVQGLNLTSNYQGLLLVSTNNSKITSNNIANNHYGIELYYSSDNVLSGNNVTANNEYGIVLGYSSNNIVSGNNVTANNGSGVVGFAIFLSSSSNNTLSGNNIANNGWGFLFGGFAILLSSSSNNTLSGNNIANNWYGIFLDSSSDNVLSGNNVTSSNRVGIRLDSSNNNVFYHNNFINNTPQVYIVTPGLANSWDDGYPSGGNYWSDYAGIDEKSGPNQDSIGSDGIGDTQYILDGDNRDKYPLMNPWSSPVGHDVAIISVVHSKTIVGESFNASINVYLANQGEQAESFNLTVYANTTVIYTLTNITLASGNFATINFTWDTTGFAKGNYTIKAYITQVSGETDTSDNNSTGGWVLVTIPGDVNGDLENGHYDVDLFDAVRLLACYGAKEGEPNFDPNCDIDNDGRVFLFDAVILLSRYGQKYP